jgi:predicted nucleotidyltransferase
MISKEKIEYFSNKIIENYHPQRVILFGSYANGEANEDSDVDMLVVMPFSGRSFDKSVEMRLKLNPEFPLDLIVMTPEYLKERENIGDYFIEDILNHGKVMYEAVND